METKNNMDFDFSEESSGESSDDSQSNNTEHDTKKYNKKKKRAASGVIITNTFLNKLLIVPLICLVLIVAFSFILRPSKVAVSDVRENTKCSDTRVFDEATVMSIGEREELEKIIGEYQEKLKLDIAVITINSTDTSLDMREYADNYYCNKNLGWNYPGGDGLILAYHTITDEIELVTKGRLVSIVDSRGLKKLSKAIRGEDSTSYFIRTMKFTQSLEGAINKTAKSDLGDKALNLIPTALFFGLFPTVLLIIMYRKNKSLLVVKAYIKDGEQMNYSDKRDILVNSSTSCRVIKSSSSSSSGGSRGSSSSGGGSL